MRRTKVLGFAAVGKNGPARVRAFGVGCLTVGFWDVITGRSRPKQANLDALFSVPTAALTLQTALGLVPTGDGAVCYRAAGGAAGTQAQHDIVALLTASEGAPEVTTSVDEFGFTWLIVDRPAVDPENPDLTSLMTDLHAVNSTLELNGFGSGLLCSLVPFTGADGRHAGLVYLYKQGTFYPFAPSGGGGQQRDNLLEINLAETVKGDLPVEADKSRWLALWGAPGL